MLVRHGASQLKLATHHPQCAAVTQIRFTRTSREELAAKVNARRPDVANKNLILELTKQNPNVRVRLFARWLGLKDRVFRESFYGRTFYTRWLWAQTTDPMYNFRRWHRLHSPDRYIKTFSPMGWAMSDLVRRLSFPDMCLVLLSSTSLSLYNAFLSNGSIVCVPPEPFSLSALAVGLLVTFRTKTSYSRYNDAVQIWGRVRANSRELCSRIMTHIPTPRSRIAEHPAILKHRDVGAKLAQTFCHALKYHITIDGSNADLRHKISVDLDDEVILKLKKEHFRDELQLIWDFDDESERRIVERLLSDDVTCWPLHVCQEVGYLNATQYVTPNAGGIGPPNSEGINALVTNLQKSISACENITQTPIYTPYTVFTGRILYGWVHTLPLVFAGLVSPVFTPVASVCTAFLFLGIDDIGQRVEQPFRILPLWQFCDVIDKDCTQLLHMRFDR